MKHCETCKYWKKVPLDDFDQIANPTDEDTCEPKEMPFEVRECSSPNITLFERNPNADGISLTDGSDYRAVMYTGPSFGCVLHEGNEG